MSIDDKLDKMPSTIHNYINNYMNSFEHLKEHNMTYVQHFHRAIYISFTLAVASAKNFFHAFYPDIWVTSASDAIRHLNTTVFSNNVDEDDDLP